MDVRAFKAKIEVLSPTSARTSIVANIDPKAPVPQAVVNYVVRSLSCAPTAGAQCRIVTAHLSCNRAMTCDQFPQTMHQVRKVAGMFLYCLKQTAKCIGTDERNCHRKRIKEDETFYSHWLFPRFERFYRQQGWSVGDEFEVEGTASSSGVESAGGFWWPWGNSNLASPPSCKPFGLRARSRLKHAIRRLKPTRRREDLQPVEPPQPQVGKRD